MTKPYKLTKFQKNISSVASLLLYLFDANIGELS